MAAQLSGVFTVRDSQLYADLLKVDETEGIQLEPSAAAGVRGPLWLTTTETGRAYLRKHDLERSMAKGTHIVWTTGGSLVPQQEHFRFQARARQLASGSIASCL